jgi:hypothetical protein
MSTITVTDERPAARQKTSFQMDFLESHITAREFLRRRIYEEVLTHNSTGSALYNGLVTPTDLEQQLNRAIPKAPRKIDWEAQYQKALEAFAGNGIIMLWNDTQIESLDEILELREGSNATFLKLVPLVGGAA